MAALPVRGHSGAALFVANSHAAPIQARMQKAYVRCSIL